MSSSAEELILLAPINQIVSSFKYLRLSNAETLKQLWMFDRKLYNLKCFFFFKENEGVRKLAQRFT